MACCLQAATGARAAGLLYVRGGGNGHGIGMSQYGADGYAQHGADYRTILAHYYQGTALGQIAPGRTVRVLLADRASTSFSGATAAGRQSTCSPSTSSTSTTTCAAWSRPAVAATRGQIVTYDGRPAVTYFFASSGGYTESIQNVWPSATPEPWLTGVPDPFDSAGGDPYHAWGSQMSLATATAKLGALVRGSVTVQRLGPGGWKTIGHAPLAAGTFTWRAAGAGRYRITYRSLGGPAVNQP